MNSKNWMYLFTARVRKKHRNIYLYCPLRLLCAKSDFIEIQLLERSEKEIMALALYLYESRVHSVHWTILFTQA